MTKKEDMEIRIAALEAQVWMLEMLLNRLAEAVQPTASWEKP